MIVMRFGSSSFTSSSFTCSGCKGPVFMSFMMRVVFTDFHGMPQSSALGYCVQCVPMGQPSLLYVEARLLHHVLAPETFTSAHLPRPCAEDELQIRARLAELESGS